MSLNEIVYIIAYSFFLAGASLSFRQNGSTLSIIIMTIGVALDVLVSLLPLAGVKALSMNVGGTNAVIMFGIALGFVVWLLYGVALVLRAKTRWRAYHIMIGTVEVLWFIDFISFLYGLYKFPLTGGS
ncbi:MAG: hypothetical protein N3B18_05105 [Desulfobacterota bacterium]|nr:hypothetical protein [Thermodesulfobacteriota bacterium]